MISYVRSLLWFSAISLLACVSGCSAVGADGEDVGGADEELAATESAIAGNRTVGSTLQTTANLNLRSGPGTTFDILVTMPLGSTVTVVKANPENGFYNVKYASQTGWASGTYLADGAGQSPGQTPPPAGAGNKTVKIGGPAVRAHVQGFANAACSNIGCPYDVGTYNGHQPTAALAIDMMMSPAGTRPKDGGAHGQRVANYGLTNAKTHKVDYVIWYQKINSDDGRGWRAMADRGSITQNHYDHVHVSFYP